MRLAGFEGFERGERGSSAEHLSDLEYKTMKESERLEAKREQLTTLEKEIRSTKGKVLTAKQIEKIPVKISRPPIWRD